MNLTKKCNLRLNKPAWLLKLDFYIAEIYRERDIEPTDDEFERLKNIVDVKLIDLRNDMKSVITTEMREDEGRRCLMIFRNGILIQTFYIE